KMSDPFNQPNPLSATSVSGSSPTSTVAVIAPAADQITNAANVQVAYQFSADGMVGVSGTFSNLWYPNQAEVPGLFNSSSSGGSAFYSRRVLHKYYVGVSYQYMDILAYMAGGHSSTETRTPVRTQTQTQTVFLFCTIN